MARASERPLGPASSAWTGNTSGNTRGAFTARVTGWPESPPSTLDRIEETARRVSAGDLSHAEAVLTAQTVTLNAMFANLAARAIGVTGADLFERYMRLAFRV